MPPSNMYYNQGPGPGTGPGPRTGGGPVTTQQPPQYQYNAPPPPPPSSQYNAPPPPSAYPNPYAPLADREQENDYPAPPSHPYDEPQIIEGSNMNSPAPPQGIFLQKICYVSCNNLLLFLPSFMTSLSINC